jgi:murein DD-endopeptidase MepM/ murein hydrolase activator NlpD
MTKPFKTFKFAPYPNGCITQYFAENPALYAPWGLAGHNGIDMVAPYGTPIFAVKAGKVVSSWTQNGGYGGQIVILSEGNTEEWTYAHLSRLDVSINTIVAEGQQIGLMGNTGFVVSGATPFWQYNPFAGTHLHLQKRLCKPYSGTGPWNLSYPTDDKLTILNYDNGYKGAVDIALDFKDVTPEGEETPYFLSIISALNYLLGRLRAKKQGAILT